MTSRRPEGQVADVERDEAEASADAEESKKTQKAGLPLALYEIVEAKAKTEDLAVRAYIRKVVAAAVGYEGPLVLSRPKADEDMTPEQKKANRQKAGKARRDLFKMLHAQFKAHPELFADMLAAQADEDDDDEGDDEDE